MRISADATEGAAMDDATKLTTADASAPAKATCHFMDHPLPFNRTRPCSGIMARVRGQVKFNRKPILEFSALFASRLGSIWRLNVRLAHGVCRADARTAPKRGAIRNQRSRTRRRNRPWR